MEYLVELVCLSSKFIERYPSSLYPELMYKLGRPYNCLLVNTHSNFFICLPFRSNIHHKYAYMFKETKRSIQSKSGIDYSKMIIIKDLSLLSKQAIVVDSDEYSEAMKNMDLIVNESLKYLDSYINHINGTHILHEKEYKRKFMFSTLQYFHDILFSNK